KLSGETEVCVRVTPVSPELWRAVACCLVQTNQGARDRSSSAGGGSPSRAPACRVARKPVLVVKEDLIVAETLTAKVAQPAPQRPPANSFVNVDMPGPAALNEYALDFWQRSLLFLDILRQRGNAREEMLARGASSVLIYDTELVMRGDALPRPVNYSLLRVIPPAGVEIDDRKRPVVVIDPRAGQGPGIGGFKSESEIGEAFKAG